MRTRQGVIAGGAALAVMLLIGLVVDVVVRPEWSFWRSVGVGFVTGLVMVLAGAAGDRRARGKGRREDPAP